MKVKDILINVAKIMELDQLYDYLTSTDMVASDDVNGCIEKLLLAINMTNSVIASQYVELTDVAYVQVYDGVIDYKNISDKNIIEIKDVTSFNGSPIEYKLCSNGIYVDDYMVNVKFSYFPSDVGLDDNIDYYSKMNSITFAYGVIAEYLFLKGDFEESNIWDNKFKQTLSSIIRPKRNIVTPAKRWL